MVGRPGRLLCQDAAPIAKAPPIRVIASDARLIVVTASGGVWLLPLSAYLSTQWTPATTIAALTPRFSPRVPALEMW